MKLLVRMLLLGYLLFPAGTWAQEAFVINSFHADLSIETDGEVVVEEQITVDFGSNERHGIFRTIPVRYEASGGSTRSIRVDGISVRANGGEAPFEQSREAANLVIKIGDPGTFVRGVQEYQITYRVQNALNGFADHDELYWNVTGNGWQTSIGQASARITLPGSSDQLQAQGYQGPFGSKEVAESATTESSFTYHATRQLGAGEGLTVVAGWPKGLVTMPSGRQRALWFLRDNVVLALPLVVLGWLVWHVRRHGKDPLGRRTIVPEFVPLKELSLLEQAALRDERIQARDLTAMIIGWAVDGFIAIAEPKRGQYELIKKKELLDRSTEERAFFDAIFGQKQTVKLKDIARTLASAASALRTSVFANLVKRDYFTKNPETVRIVYVIIGVVLMISSLWIGLPFGLPSFLAIFLSGLIFLAAAPFMPKRTVKGVEAKDHIDGFQLYLKTAERYRLRFAEKEKLFERYLPYAIAFGVATLWAKAFSNVAKAAPSWYSGHYVGPWSPVNFTSGIEHGFSSGINNAMMAASSGGSGFSGGGSGGGFGGGGGGSW